MLTFKPYFAFARLQIPPTLQVAWPIAFGHRFVGAAHASRIPNSTLPFPKGGEACAGSSC